MTTRRGVFLLALLSVGPAVVAPGARADDGAEAAGRARGVLRRYCKDCHGGPAEQDKADLQVLDPKQLRLRKLVPKGGPDDSELVRLVEYGSMPPGDLPKPRPAEVQTLREWVAAGAPDFPPEYGNAYVLGQIKNDLLSLKPADVKYQRYVSFNHLLAEDAAGDATLWRDALLKALNHLTLKSAPVPVTPIDPTGSIFRVDERQIGWDSQFFEATDFKGNVSKSHVDLFDLLLLEYPYATVPGAFAGDRQILADYLRQANPVRPILYVRGDWLVSTATQPPLYEDLLRLPRMLTGPDGLEAKIGSAGPPAWAVFLDSRVSKLPQLVERRSAADGAYWRTFDTGAAKDMKDLLHQAMSGPHGGGLMLFSLPNGFNGYYIAKNVADDGGKRLTRLAASAPAAWAVDPAAADQVARNGLSCMRCHAAGVEMLRDASRPALDELAAADRAPLLPLFPGREAMDKFLADDAARFRAAVKAVFGGPLDREPLTPVTRRYFQGVHPAPAVPAPGVDVQGVATPVAAFGDKGGGELARFPADFDAPPMRPLDGLTLPDYQPPLPAVDVTIEALDFKTKKPTPTFLPGDQLTIEVANQGKNAAYFELIGIYVDGHITVHEAPRKLAAGEKYRYPEDRTRPPGVAAKKFIEMGLPPGIDRYVLFASDAEFPAAVRLRSAKEKGIADRAVHPFWQASQEGGGFDPSRLVKKTCPVETREP